MSSTRTAHALLDDYHHELTGLVSMQIISIARSVTFMCIGAILFGTQHVGNMDLALLPVIDSINHNSSSLVSFLSFKLFQTRYIYLLTSIKNKQAPVPGCNYLCNVQFECRSCIAHNTSACCCKCVSHNSCCHGCFPFGGLMVDLSCIKRVRQMVYL